MDQGAWGLQDSCVFVSRDFWWAVDFFTPHFFGDPPHLKTTQCRVTSSELKAFPSAILKKTNHLEVLLLTHNINKNYSLGFMRWLQYKRIMRIRWHIPYIISHSLEFGHSLAAPVSTFLEKTVIRLKSIENWEGLKTLKPSNCFKIKDSH
jgi:hypothetical protein